jgi:hypothetical protein
MVHCHNAIASTIDWLCVLMACHWSSYGDDTPSLLGRPSNAECAKAMLLSAGFRDVESALCVDRGRSQRRAKRYASFQSNFGLRVPVPELHSVLSMRTGFPLPGASAKE